MTWVEIGSGVRPSSFATCSSTAGRDVGEGADRAGDRAGRDVVARRDQPLAVAGEFGIGLRELEPEGRRLGVDAVAAADGRRQLVLERAALEHLEQRVEIRDQQVGGLLQLHRERGVEHVGAGHALVQPAPLRPELLAGPGQEGDHVMLGDRLDRVDRGDVDLAQHVARHRPRGWSPRPRPGSCRSCPSPRPRTPRSATRCGSGSRPTRWPSFRGGNSGGPWRGRLAEAPRCIKSAGTLECLIAWAAIATLTEVSVSTWQTSHAAD